MTYTIGSSFALGHISTLNDGEGPSVTTLANGQIATVWIESNVNAQTGVTDDAGIFGRILNADGTQTSTFFQANTTVVDTQDEPTITALTGGGFVVSWTHRPVPEGSGSQDVDIFAQVFDASGAKVGGEINVFPDVGAGSATTADDQELSRITPLANGGFIMSWTDGHGTGATAQVFSSDGAAQGSAVNVSGPFGYSPAMPVELANGDIAIVVGGNLRLSGANLTDAPVGVTDAVAPVVVAVVGATSVAALPNGGLVIVGFSTVGYTDSYVHVKLLNASGEVGKSVSLHRPGLNLGTPSPQVAVRPDGSFGVVWQDKVSALDYDIGFVEFGADGLPIGVVATVNDFTNDVQKQADITVTLNGDYFVTYHSSHDPINADKLRGTIIDMADSGGSTGGGGGSGGGGGTTDPVLPTIDGKTLVTGGGKNTLRGSGLNDSLDAGGGNDKLIGKAGDDILNGGNGRDILLGGPGNDILNGDGGNDRIIGGPGKDTINGGAGKDVILGGPGDDVITGGTEADRFVFQKRMGNDTITDFQDDVDTIVLDNAIWGGTKKVNKVLNLFASIDGDDVVFDFGGHTLRIEGVNDIDLLKNDLIIV